MSSTYTTFAIIGERVLGRLSERYSRPTRSALLAVVDGREISGFESFPTNSFKTRSGS